jgi:hypothetical protein
MHPVSGFGRPLVQWLFVALAIALIAIAAAEAFALRRVHGENESLRAARLESRVQQEQLEGRLAHEQATREALALELTRLRGSGSASTGPPPPTLTLTPITRRGAQPPGASVAEPGGAQLIQLRLVLPRGQTPASARYTIAVRTWSGGETVWQRSGVTGSTVDGQPMVTTFVAGDVFTAGAYEVLLTEIAEKPIDVAAYEVTVRSR